MLVILNEVKVCEGVDRADIAGKLHGSFGLQKVQASG